MEKALFLQAQTREQTGSKAAEKVRKEGKIPAIVYGHKQQPTAVSLDMHDFTEGLHHGHRLVDVEIDGKTDKMLIKDIQYDYLGRSVIHVDLMRVDVTEMIKLTVPLKLKGQATAKGTHEGGFIEEHATQLEVECMATNIPESIIVSVKEIGVGDTLHASDIELPEGVKLVSPADTIVVTCHLASASKTDEELEAEEGPAEPEIITESKKDKEQDEES